MGFVGFSLAAARLETKRSPLRAQAQGGGHCNGRGAVVILDRGQLCTIQGGVV